MTSNEKQPARHNPQDDYEATVLDFLDKEMAAAQPAHETDKQSKELDALVSDLLKQVITETDHPKNGSKLLFDEDELFSGLTQEQKTSGSLAEAPPVTPVAPAPMPAPAPSKGGPRGASGVSGKKKAKSAQAAEAASVRESKPKEASTKPAPVLALGLAKNLAQTKKLPVPAIAIGSLVLIVAGAAYFFFGSSDKSSEAVQPQAAVTQPEVKTAPPPPPVQPEEKPVAKAKPTPSKAVAQSFQPAKNQPAAQQPKTAVAAAKPEPKPVVAVSMQSQQIMETAPAPAPAQPAPAPTAAAPRVAAADKPASSPSVNNPSPATQIVSERKPVEELAARPSASIPTPALERTLIEAVPITQVSPAYPEIALRTRTSASVALELQIDANGKVVKATPVSGPAMFHQSAVSAALRWRYKPASIGGANVPSQSKVTMVFNLNK